MTGIHPMVVREVAPQEHYHAIHKLLAGIVKYSAKNADALTVTLLKGMCEEACGHGLTLMRRAAKRGKAN